MGLGGRHPDKAARRRTGVEIFSVAPIEMGGREIQELADVRYGPAPPWIMGRKLLLFAGTARRRVLSVGHGWASCGERMELSLTLSARRPHRRALSLYRQLGTAA